MLEYEGPPEDVDPRRNRGSSRFVKKLTGGEASLPKSYPLLSILRVDNPNQLTLRSRQFPALQHWDATPSDAASLAA
jgi:hypothetical protein